MIYLPMVPEAAIAMLACARIGAIHSVIFGGFSAESVRDRVNDAKAKVIITADGGYRRGQVVPLKRNADRALEETPSIENVVVVRRRPGAEGDLAFPEIVEGRDHWWHRLMYEAEQHEGSFYRAPEALVHQRACLHADRDSVWICHRGAEVARYPRSYEQGVWLPPPIMRAEPPNAAPAPLLLPPVSVAPPELSDYAALCA